MLGSLLKQRQQHAKGHVAAPGEICERAHHLSAQMKRTVGRGANRLTVTCCHQFLLYGNIVIESVK